jgi:acyl-CoA synthetase (AMP-forming)/AMP-acid ligase II
LTDYLRRNARAFPDKAAVVFETDTITWAELSSAVEDMAASIGPALQSNSQEVVAILMPNSIEFIISYLAILYTGHMALPLDPAYKPLEYDILIEQIPPRLIISNQEYANKISHTHSVKTVIFEDIDSKKRKYSPLRFNPSQQIASLTFTSGTTGKPKAVPNTHANHLWNIEVCSKVWKWTSDDTLLVSLPLSHMHGIVICLSGALYHGNTIYLHKWFDAAATLKALSSGKISFFTHAASAYVKLVQVSHTDHNLSAVRLCISGAAPLPPEVWRQFKRLYGVEILETYGTSETGRIAGNSLEERVLGSPGKPLPGVDLKLAEDGEVLVKSGGVFPGYFQNPEATKASLTADGYWRTGDIADLKDGYVFLKGRVQERIRRFGYTVSPRDVEWALLKNPAIKDAYVMARQRQTAPDDELFYFIVSDLSDDEITDYTKANLLFAWRPDKIIRLQELPRTASGKPSMPKFREMISQ